MFYMCACVRVCAYEVKNNMRDIAILFHKTRYNKKITIKSLNNIVKC